MASRELLRIALVVDLVLGVLVLTSYGGFVLSDVEPPTTTITILQVSAVLVVVNAAIIVAVYRSGWEPL